tara:strand:+ start:586 stop:828 length:243 start_codon:yes stop_codon:yes gene_type:complete
MKQLNKEVSLPKKEQVKKVAHITYTDDYGGLRAWLIQESYDGVIHNPVSHMVVKREYFSRLQGMIEDYLSEGFDVEIKNK